MLISFTTRHFSSVYVEGNCVVILDQWIASILIALPRAISVESLSLFSQNSCFLLKFQDLTHQYAG